MSRVALAALTLTLALAAPGRAAAQPGEELATLWLALDPGPVDGFGVGARYLMPLAEGVVRHPRIRDEFTLEMGGDFLHYGDTVGAPPYEVEYSWNGVLLAVGPAWNFWFTPRFAVYPKLDLGFAFGSYRGWVDDYGYRRRGHGGLYLDAAIGMILELGRAKLRVELGSDISHVGLGFEL